MKKYILGLIVISLTLFSCKEKTEGFSISGKILNAKGRELILTRLSPTQVINIDTVKLDDKGEFNFTGRSKVPEFYMLSISKTEYFNLLVDSLEQIKITADTKDFAKTYKIIGSEGSILVKNLYDKLTETTNKIDSISKIFNSKRTDTNADSLKAIYDPQIIKIISNQKEFSKSFIDKNINSLASIVALSQTITSQTPILSPDEDIEYFEKVDVSLNKKYPKSETVISLHQYLEKTKNTISNIKIGGIAPDINLASPAGSNITLYSLRGNYVLLDFWASWCRPCRMENPNLVQNFLKYKTKGFTIYQVSLDQTADKWKEAILLDKLGAWSHVSDLLYWDSAPAKKYGIQGIPANFLLDPQGKIIATNLRGDDLGKKLAEIYGF